MATTMMTPRKGLSGSAIFGIVFAVISFLITVILVMVFLTTRKFRRYTSGNRNATTKFNPIELFLLKITLPPADREMIPQLNSNNDRQDVRKEDRVERGGGGQGEAMHSRNTEMDLGGERPTRTRSDNENENPFDDEVNKSTTAYPPAYPHTLRKSSSDSMEV